MPGYPQVNIVVYTHDFDPALKESQYTRQWQDSRLSFWLENSRPESGLISVASLSADGSFSINQCIQSLVCYVHKKSLWNHHVSDRRMERLLN